MPFFFLFFNLGCIACQLDAFFYLRILANYHSPCLRSNASLPTNYTIASFFCLFFCKSQSKSNESLNRAEKEKAGMSKEGIPYECEVFMACPQDCAFPLQFELVGDAKVWASGGRLIKDVVACAVFDISKLSVSCALAFLTHSNPNTQHPDPLQHIHLSPIPLHHPFSSVNALFLRDVF